MKPPSWKTDHIAQPKTLGIAFSLPAVKALLSFIKIGINSALLINRLFWWYFQSRHSKRDRKEVEGRLVEPVLVFVRVVYYLFHKNHWEAS